jgi:hypothetical protein
VLPAATETVSRAVDIAPQKALINRMLRLQILTSSMKSRNCGQRPDLKSWGSKGKGTEVTLGFIIILFVMSQEVGDVQNTS